MLFCPYCGTYLVYRLGREETHSYVYACTRCSYEHKIKEPVVFTAFCKLKEIEDAVGGEEAWKNAQSTNENCPLCEHERAYFMELQTRSADEPATVFYRCCECHHVWKSD